MILEFSALPRSKCFCFCCTDVIFETIFEFPSTDSFTCLRQMDLAANFIASVVESVAQARAAGNANMLPSICSGCILSAVR